MESSDFLLNQQEIRSLHSEAPTPLYYRLYTLLKSHILDGSIRHGTKLPTEEELAEVFEVSRITTKRAMDELAAEGLVERRRGKGTHVIHMYKPKPVAAPLTGMLENLESMAHETKVKKMLLCKKMPAPGDIQREFSIDDDTRLFKVVRVRADNNRPFAYYTSWTLGADDIFDRKSLKTKSRFRLMKEHGINLSHVEQTLTAVAATAEVAEHLEVDVGAPLLSLTRRTYDTNDKLVDILFGLYNPDRFQYQMSLSAK